MAKQIMFVDTEDNNNCHGGILLDNGDVICACCGGLFEASDMGTTWCIIQEFDQWINIDDEICRDAPRDCEDIDQDIDGFDEVYE